MIPNGILCLLTDYGTRDRFTGIIKGVAFSVDPDLKIIDLTHDIEPFNIAEAAYVLSDTIAFWPQGTVFAAVVDPGVGSGRKAIAALTLSGHIIICPDNGLLTIVHDDAGLREIREINTALHRLPGTRLSSTFHGRDIFVYNAARVAARQLKFRELGLIYNGRPVRLDLPDPLLKKNKISGIITRIERPFGNLCTNIRADLFRKNQWNPGQIFRVRVFSGNTPVLAVQAQFAGTFSKVPPGNPILYIDSSDRIGMARNRTPVKAGLNIKPGSAWRVDIERVEIKKTGRK